MASDAGEPAPIRSASEADAGAIHGIYAPIVRDTPISFEVDPPSVEELAVRIGRTLERYAWIVWDLDGRIEGYAYATAFNPRAAYRWTVEVSVYVSPATRGRGIGRALLRDLLARLARLGFVNVIARITLPNPGSVRLFESLGFEPVGITRSIGFKLGRWHDVGEWQLLLKNPPSEPDRPHADDQI